MLADAGHTVDIFLDEPSYSYCASNFNHSGVTTNVLPSPAKKVKSNLLLTFLAKCSERFLRFFSLKIRYKIIFPEKESIISMLKNKIVQSAPDIIITYEIRSLASLFWNITIPVVYINFELLDWNEGTWAFHYKYLLKTIEKDMLPKLAKVYVTSPLRAQIFVRINNCPDTMVHPLPVVPQGLEQAQSNNYFRKKFNLSQDIKIVLHAGHIVPWTLLHEIIPTVSQWPEKTVFVIHTWDKQKVPTDYLEQLITLANGLPVFFSFESIPKNDVCSAWASADIGIAFYQSIDDNFTEILFSSNKFGEYMKAGLPVICSNHPSLKEFVDRHGIGKAISTTGCATSVIDICNKYDEYAAAVKQCHQQYFVLERYVKTFMEDIKNIVDKRK